MAGKWYKQYSNFYLWKNLLISYYNFRCFLQGFINIFRFKICCYFYQTQKFCSSDPMYGIYQFVHCFCQVYGILRFYNSEICLIQQLYANNMVNQIKIISYGALTLWQSGIPKYFHYFSKIELICEITYCSDCKPLRNKILNY